MLLSLVSRTISQQNMYPVLKFAHKMLIFSKAYSLNPIKNTFARISIHGIIYNYFFKRISQNRASSIWGKCIHIIEKSKREFIKILFTFYETVTSKTMGNSFSIFDVVSSK